MERDSLRRLYEFDVIESVGGSFIYYLFYNGFFAFWGLNNTCRTIIKPTPMQKLERFLIECRKTKTKVITLANHKGHG